MNIHPFGCTYRTRSKTTILAIAAALLLLAGPTQARAAGGHSTANLAEGVGMVAKPSVRVRALQRALMHNGYSPGASGIDGRFGPRTARAVRRFQSARHLAVDGIVGRRTRAALRRATVALERGHRSTRHTTGLGRPASVNPRRVASIGDPGGATARPASIPPLTLAADHADGRHALLLGTLGALLAAIAALVVAAHQRRSEAAAYRRSRLRKPAVRRATRSRTPALAAARGDGEPPGSLAVNGHVDAALAAGVGLARDAPVIGYIPVPAGTDAQEIRTSRRAIERACERGGWRLVDLVHDPDGGALLERMGVARALERISTGEARGLVVSDSRLLGRDVDLADLLRRLQAADAALVAVDLGLDTSTPQGRRVASALITMSGWGRHRIATPRTSNGNGVTHIRSAARFTPRNGREGAQVVGAHEDHGERRRRVGGER